MTLTWLADALRAEGCRVVEEGDWEHRGRPGTFDPYGVLWHHTGSTSSASNPFPTKDVLINGRPDLAGPLCQVGIGYDGVCHVIAAGRANHAGACNGWGPFTSAEDGNTQLVGFEIDYDGTQAMSAAQQDAATRCSAAVLKRFGKNESYAARHEETSTTGKWDTGGISGDQLRSMIGNYLDGKGDDVPNYVHTQRVSEGHYDTGWRDITWDNVIAGDDVASDGSASIMINGHLYSATLMLQVTTPVTTGADSASTIKTRTVEGDVDTPDGKFQVLEANPSLEHKLTTGSTLIQDSRCGQCNATKGNSARRLRFQVYLPYDDCVISNGDLILFYW